MNISVNILQFGAVSILIIYIGCVRIAAPKKK